MSVRVVSMRRDTGLVYHSTLLAAPSDAEDRLVVKPSNTVPAFQHAKMLYRKQVVPLRQVTAPHQKCIESFLASIYVHLVFSDARSLLAVLCRHTRAS
jgi:hypothetical protein